MSPRSKALLALLVAPPILTEIVSGNTPVRAVLDPRIAIFLVLVYSFPLLIIREISWRCRLSIAGTFFLGLAYGVLNEGLLAQTLLRYDHVPIDKFDHYICFGGFNFSWAAVIVPWHALFAVFFPLALLALWFPSCAEQTWLGKRAFTALVAIMVASMTFISLARPPHPQMLACFLGIAALTCAAFFFRHRNLPHAAPSPRRATPSLFGLVSYPVFFLGAILLAARHAPAAVFFLFVAIVCFGQTKMSQHWGFLLPPAAAYLAFGAYFSISLFHLFAGMGRHSPEEIGTGATLAGVFVLLSRTKSPPRIAPNKPLC